MCLRAFCGILSPRDFAAGYESRPSCRGYDSQPDFCDRAPRALGGLGGLRVRIFIADADRELRLGLQMLLHQEAGMHVTGMAVQTEGLAAQVAASQPDVLLVDWHLPGGSIPEVLAAIRKSARYPRTIVLSVHAELEQDAIAAGADLFIAKNTTPHVLLDALRSMETDRRVHRRHAISHKRSGEAEEAILEQAEHK
jgi:DNA-binding NarL/FixJ family response regulator